MVHNVPTCVTHPYFHDFLLGGVHQIAQGVACIVLANFDINKEQNHRLANLVQNLSLGLNLSTVVVNIMINGLEVKQMSDHGAGLSGGLSVKDE